MERATAYEAEGCRFDPGRPYFSPSVTDAPPALRRLARHVRLVVRGHADEAHLDEHPLGMREAAGSIPALGSHAAVAQWTERRFPKAR